MAKTFEYEVLAHAQQDLLLFSQMIIHEDKTLYLVVSDENKYRIEHSIETSDSKQDTILMIAINGVLFKREYTPN